eukprot:jgi/Ulvmu1/7127/UM034_0033.1
MAMVRIPSVAATAAWLLAGCAGFAAHASSSGAPPPAVTATSLITAAEQLISWQQSTIGDVASFLPPDKLDTFVFRRTVNPRGWVHAAFLIGLKDWAEATDNERHWLWLKDFAEAQDFELGERLYHADDQAVAQYYLALSSHFDLPEAAEPAEERFQTVVTNPSDVDLDHSVKASRAERALDYNRACQFRWCWCDALFMAPPGYFALSAATGNASYAAFADSEFWVTTDYLFRDLPAVANDAGLFLRDSTFFDKRDANGDSIFWSRGNGWVFAGLPAILETLPGDDPRRPRYERLFKKMARAIKASQVTSGKYSGFWGPSLLAFDLYPFPESSGTGFFVGGICWGIRNGLLSASAYADVAVRGWQALLSAQEPEGRIGWVQQIGSGPEEVQQNVTQMYGGGAFLQAAAGMLRLHNDGTLILNTIGAPRPSDDTSARGFSP